MSITKLQYDRQLTYQLKVFCGLFGDFLRELCIKVCQVFQLHFKPIPTHIIMPSQLITDITICKTCLTSTKAKHICTYRLS